MKIPFIKLYDITSITFQSLYGNDYKVITSDANPGEYFVASECLMLERNVPYDSLSDLYSKFSFDLHFSHRMLMLKVYDDAN